MDAQVGCTLGAGTSMVVVSVRTNASAGPQATKSFRYMAAGSSAGTTAARIASRNSAKFNAKAPVVVGAFVLDAVPLRSRMRTISWPAFDSEFRRA